MGINGGGFDIGLILLDFISHSNKHPVCECRTVFLEGIRVEEGRTRGKENQLKLMVTDKQSVL